MEEIDKILEEYTSNRYRIYDRLIGFYNNLYFIAESKDVRPNSLKYCSLNFISFKIIKVLFKKNHFMFITTFPFVNANEESRKDLLEYFNSERFAKYNNNSNIGDLLIGTIYNNFPKLEGNIKSSVLILDSSNTLIFKKI